MPETTARGQPASLPACLPALATPFEYDSFSQSTSPLELLLDFFVRLLYGCILIIIRH